MKKLLTLCIILLLSVLDATAISFEDKDLKAGRVIKLSDALDYAETHGDIILTNDMSHGLASPKGPLGNEHRSFLDYRLETHLPLYNLAKQRGRIITRIAGSGFVDENINGFFDDQLIDIPELFFQNDTEIGDNDLRFVFGKFANRRFMNKDEINSDPFDIGEMRFSGAIANTLNLLNSINEFRDDDHKFNGTRQATGSYGFNLGIKNQNRSGGLAKRWGFEQVLAVSQLDNFAANFYGISELNKDWGNKLPGRLRLGVAYANNQVYRLANNNENTYLIYSSLAQKINERLKFYLRYGTLYRNFTSGLIANNEYRAGFYYKWAKRFSSHHWLGYFDGDAALAEDDNRLHWVNVLSYKLSQHFYTNLAAVFRFNQFNAGASNLQDNNYTIALQLRYFR